MEKTKRHIETLRKIATEIEQLEEEDELRIGSGDSVEEISN